MALSTNIVSYWKLDGNSNDAAGSNNGTDTGITYSSGNGIISQGAGFGGASTNCINIGTTSTLNFTSSDFSFNLWVKSSNYNHNVAGVNSTLIYKGAFGTTGYYLQINPSGSNGIVNFRTNQAGASQLLASTTTLTAGSWNMLTITRSGSAGKIYINGTEVTYTTQDALVSPASSTDPFYLGAYTSATSGNYDAAMDEVGVWSRALTSTEITSLYNSGAGLAYPFGTAYTKTLTETSTFTDTLIKAATKVLSEAKTYTDTLSRVWTLGRTLTETVTNTASVIKTAGRTLLEAVTSPDTFTEGKVVTVGPNSPSAAVDNGGVNAAWSNPTNAEAADGVFATVVVTSACFVAGTSVATPYGAKNIEDIIVGDIVLAFDPSSHMVFPKRVAATFAHPKQSYLHIGLANGSSLEVTGNHPIFTPSSSSFVAAEALRVGDTLLSVDGSLLTLESIMPGVDMQPVYNIEVEDLHTYFAAGIGVHNKP